MLIKMKVKVKPENECKTMEEAIERAKKQVKDWYNPDTPRVWIENECNYNLPQYSNDGGYLKIFVLQGGEPKGVVIANYHIRVVVALSIWYNDIKMYRVARNCMPYDEQVFDARRYPRD